MKRISKTPPILVCSVRLINGKIIFDLLKATYERKFRKLISP